LSTDKSGKDRRRTSAFPEKPNRSAGALDEGAGRAQRFSRETARRPLPALQAGKENTMAKGQKRSNKEVKKPKQEKPKSASAAASTSTRLTESQERSKGSKK
jgi:hypothetical protein